MNAPAPIAQSEHQRARIGLYCGLAAYTAWGVLPVYFKALAGVPPSIIVAHRIVWSLVALAVLVTVMKGWPAVREAARNRRALGTLAITATLIAVNWLLYVYAINSGHVLAGSLGYYLNPLANIVLARFFLGEALSKRQWTAVAIAAAGVAVLAAGALDTLWLSLTLCFSFATYGLLRKIAPVESLAGLSIETTILAPIALAWLAMGGSEGKMISDYPAEITGLLVAAGLVSTVPLLCFTAAARRLPYSTVGMLQFLAPTLQFLCAVWLYGEPFGRAHQIAFGAIWAALALYTVALVRAPRPPQLPE